MGVFLAGPLVAALTACAAAGGRDAQVILETLVPLVYRPALKVCLDSLCCTVETICCSHKHTNCSAKIFPLSRKGLSRQLRC